MRIVGHTDPVGDDSYNLTLGLRRAEEVARLLKVAIDKRVARMVSVVAPQSTAAVTPSASPIHCRSPDAGAWKPSAKAQATPEKAATKPASWNGARRSLRVRSGSQILHGLNTRHDSLTTDLGL